MVAHGQAHENVWIKRLRQRLPSLFHSYFVNQHFILKLSKVVIIIPTNGSGSTSSQMRIK